MHVHPHCTSTVNHMYMNAPIALCMYMNAPMLWWCRNERDTALAKVAHKLTKDPDQFLGEKVIEVRRVGAPRDVWYKLGKCKQ